MFDFKKDYEYFIFLSLNWIFGLLFLWAGIFDAKAGGLLLILVSLLLIPPVRDKIFSLTDKRIKIWARSLCIFSLLIVFFMVNNPKQQPLHLETQLTIPANTIKPHQENTNLFAKNSTDIQIKSKKKDNLPEKAIQIQSSNTKQANQITKNESDSEINTKDILEKLKNISVSQYEQNRSLYQQLVNFNPSENKYKKKLSYYSKKIKQQSRNTAKKNTELTCGNIGTNETLNYSPNWISANEHCLSKNQKKEMELALFKKVKSISSNKIEKNWEGYKSLSILNPNKKYYLNKLKHYENKLKLRTAQI